MRQLLSFVAFLTLVGAGAASAATIDPLAALKDFNAIIFTNATTPSDIEGAAVIGGNFSGATVYNNPTTGLMSGYGALTVYGSTSGNSINLNNGGSAYVGGTKGASVNFNGGGHYTGGPPNTIADFVTAFSNFSASLSQLSSTSSLPPTNNNEVIKATAGANGVAVFNITAAQLDAIPSYKLNLNGATSVIFNVSGTTINFNGNNQTGMTGADSIIWNFYQAQNVNFGTQFVGTVLAPLAAVANQNQIDGVLVAKSWTGTGELHDYGYTGKSPTAVPEPSTWAMMLVGVGAVGLVLRGRRQRSGLKGAAITPAGQS